MSEFNNLVQTICNPSTPQQSRTAAEQQLLEILSNIDTWKQYSECLYTADDTVCFFVCIGFQKMVWRQWRRISSEDKILLSQTVVSALTNRKKLQSFAKSKLEQVLATICVNSCSIDPVLGLLVDASNPAVSVGLSTMRTVLELVLSDDPQLYPEYKPTLLSAVTDIVSPLTNLACGACTTAITRAADSSSSAEQNDVDMNTALDLLKVIISKLQIGAHVTSDTVDLLFRVAELGAVGLSNHTSAAPSNLSREALGKAAHSAIEILTEIMSKKYLPPAPHSTTAGAGAAPSSSTDSSLHMLGVVLAKTTALLQGIRSAGELEDSPVAMSLLEFVSVFAESHLERCIQLSSVCSQNSSSSSAVVDQNMDRAVSLFLEELVATTVCTSSVEVLHKAVSVWNHILLLGAVKERLLGQGALCLSVVSHLLQCCLLQTNESLRDSAEELLEDLPVDVLTDPHMRAVLGHIIVEGSGGDTAVAGAEEVGYVGTELLRDTITLFADLVGSPEVAGWLAQTVEQVVGQCVARLHSGSERPSPDALDLLFLVRILPLVSNSAPQLTQQLLGLAVQLTTARSHSRGTDFIILEVTCCHQAGQLLQSGRVVPSSAAAITTDTLTAMQRLFCDPSAGLLVGLSHACSDSTTPTTVNTALSILLLQTVSVHLDILEVEQQQCVAVKQAVLELLQTIISQRFAELPVEIAALHICTQDLLQPHSVAPAIVAQCMELVGTIEAAAQHNYSNLNNSTIGMYTVLFPD